MPRSYRRGMETDRQEIVQPGVLPDGARLVGYVSRSPMFTDAVAGQIGRAVDWIKSQNDGEAALDDILNVWRRTGPAWAVRAPAWVRAGLRLGYTADLNESAEKNWREETRTIATCYAWVIRIKKTRIVVKGNGSVISQRTNKKTYRAMVERLRDRNSGADLLREIIADIEALLTRWEGNRQAARLLGTVLPALRDELVRLRGRLDRIIREAA